MAAEQTQKRKVDRSPRYPSIPLPRALDRARELYRAEGRHAALPEIAVTHWGYTPKSSGGRLTLAALRAFGLVENAGGGVKLSERALRIILDEREPSPERIALIRDAALSPKIHRKLWDKYKADLPSEASLRHTLLLEFDFAEGAIRDFVREYRETLAFAGLDGSVTIDVAVEDKGPALDEEWDEGGVSLSASQFPRSEGAERTASPMVAPVTNPIPQGGVPLPPPLAAGFKQDVFTLAEGDVVLRWPDGLSSESFEELRGWLEIMKKKIARAAGVDLKKIAEPGE